MLHTDFWWLSTDESRKYGYIDLFHQEPYSDEPNTDRDPCSCPMLQNDRRYVIRLINQWRAKFKNINVFRSLTLYTSDTNGQEIIGPLLLDIDRPLEKDGGYLMDLSKALEDTRLLVKKYCSNLKDEDYRIFFTGHKGFHIEIHPRTINMPLNADRWRYFEKRCKEINAIFGDRFIDRLHPHVRLHNSINSWTDYSGRRIYSMNFEVDIGELFRLSAEDISEKAKNLALRALTS